MQVNPTDIVQQHSEQRDFSGNLLTARQHQPQKVLKAVKVVCKYLLKTQRLSNTSKWKEKLPLE